MEVYAGMIVGFDHDDPSVFERQFEFLRPVPHRRRDGRHALGDPQDAPVRPP